MLGLDTNVLVRYLVRDDQEQFEKAARVILREVAGGEPVFVSLLVLLEMDWVLRSRYGLSKTEILAVLSAQLESSDKAMEDEGSVEAAVYSWEELRRGFRRLSDRSS